MEYKRGEKQLIYVSTMHTSDVGSKTHSAINEIIRTFKSEAVVVEVPPFEGQLSDSIIERCDLAKKCVEGLYAYKKHRPVLKDAFGEEVVVPLN